MKATTEIQAIPLVPVSLCGARSSAHRTAEQSGLIIETHASGTNVEGRVLIDEQWI